MSWRKKDERRRERGVIEDRMHRQSEGVGWNLFIRLLIAPIVVVAVLLLPHGLLETPVLVAIVALAVVVVWAVLKVSIGRDRTRSSSALREEEMTIWDRAP